MQLIRLLKPELKVHPDAEFIVDKVEREEGKFTSKVLFAGPLRLVTPIIWIVSIISSFVVYLLNSWMPQLLTSSGLTLAEASVTTSVFHIAGILGGPVVGWILDKYGMVACSAFPIGGCIVMLLLGLPIEGMMLTMLVALAGFFVIGAQGILTISTPMFYPTSFRSKGNGTAMGIAKIGSIFGPIVGGVLMAQLTLSQLFMFNGGIIAFGAILIITLGVLSRKILHIKRERSTAFAVQERPAKAVE
ncbi:MFS transporter [Bacillus thermotolerans]|uniref:MFS transporter n=1 Tax=Bacillus thermotolerans TaxID=1221996 RepID=UPI000582B7FF|nr:MFS transporter [Bacillus thermotolerans]KKB34315.1 4-hydroxybenzoate transporter [Bacillus thermotolerans]